MSDQEKIKDLQDQLQLCQTQNKEQSEFLSMLAHQLRTPLSGTKWTFKMLLDGDLGTFTPEQRTIVQKGYENNERMIKLLQEVIYANQNELWNFHYKHKPVELKPFIASVVTEFLEEARAHSIHIVYDRGDDDIPPVDLDPSKIYIVLENLLENALRYNHPDGQVVIRIYREKSKEGFITISLFNTGIGIPEKEQDKIFTKFFRAQNAKEKEPHGTGLGLFTAKRIVERHGGDFSFESVQDQGITFYITLPISQPKSSQDSKPIVQ